MSPLESGARWLQATGRLPSVVAARVAEGAVTEVVGLGAEPDTQFRVGSITKTLVAVLVLQLRDAGELTLDDRLAAHLGELAGAPYGEVTLAQLLSHTGGLQSEPVGPWWERSPGVDLAALLAANRGDAAVATPPSWFHYSNLGYAFLGEVVARRHGRPWWQVVEERLLGPLGMTRTTYAPAAPYAQGSSVGHLTGVVEREPHHDTGAMAPAGQVWSTVPDLARWSGLLAAGHPDVVAGETVREMGRSRASDSYGWGLRRVDMAAAGRPGVTWVGHTGSMPGFVASLFVDQAPDGRGEGAVLLTNATTGLVADEVPWVLTTGRPAVDPWVPTSHVPEPVEHLLGTWFWGNTAVELRWSNETLELRTLATGRLSDRFALDGDRVVGLEGYHRGETLHVRPDRLECATFVYTRTPYGRRPTGG